MRVMVTGGTGFVGGHVTNALLEAGHQPRLLVRDPSKLARLCEMFGIEPGSVEAIEGDMLDEASVLGALDGCEACVHSAAFTSLTPEEMPKALDVNAPGSRIVLDAAPGPERIYAILSDVALPVELVTAQLRTVAGGGAGVIRATRTLPLPARAQLSLVFEKARP